METPCIKFRYLRHAQIHLGDGKLYPIPYRMGPKLVGNSQIPDPACETGVPHFDMTKVHEVEIADEVPQLPEKEEYMDDAMYREVCKDGFEEAREARKRNAAIRRSLDVYVKSGAIEIVDDPFGNKPKMSAKELAAKAVRQAGGSFKEKPTPKPASEKPKSESGIPSEIAPEIP